MRGDRIRVTTGTLYEDSPDALVYVYGVKLDSNGTPVRAFDNTVQLESLGGVKNGSTGVIVGEAEKAHRGQLKDNEQPLGLGANDFVEVIPVMLDTYQRLGWFPIKNVRVVSGGVAQ